jgi:hypothetical protein
MIDKKPLEGQPFFFHFPDDVGLRLDLACACLLCGCEPCFTLGGPGMGCIFAFSNVRVTTVSPIAKSQHFLELRFFFRVLLCAYKTMP